MDSKAGNIKEMKLHVDNRPRFWCIIPFNSSSWPSRIVLIADTNDLFTPDDRAVKKYNSDPFP